MKKHLCEDVKNHERTFVSLKARERVHTVAGSPIDQVRIQTQEYHVDIKIHLSPGINPANWPQNVCFIQASLTCMTLYTIYLGATALEQC